VRLEALLSDNLTCIYKDDTVELFFEYHEEIGLIFHVTSHKWSKAVYRHYKEVFESVMGALKAKGHRRLSAPIARDDKRLQHFARLFGFQQTDQLVLCTDASTKYIWVKDW